MATTNLGKVAVVPRGEYDANVQYEKLDIVQYERQSYLVKQSVLGVTPSTGSEYVLLAGRGDSSYEVAIKNGYVGTEAEWLLHIKADGSIQALQKFMTNPAETDVQVPDYGNIPSLQGHVKQMFQNGGLPAEPFATKALMTASALVDGDYAMVTDDAVNNGLYVKTAGIWVKSAYDPLEQAKAYADSNPLFKPQQLPESGADANTLMNGVFLIWKQAVGDTTLNLPPVVGKNKTGIIFSYNISGLAYQRYIRVPTFEKWERVSNGGSIGSRFAWQDWQPVLDRSDLSVLSHSKVSYNLFKYTDLQSEGSSRYQASTTIENNEIVLVMDKNANATPAVFYPQSLDEYVKIGNTVTFSTEGYSDGVEGIDITIHALSSSGAVIARSTETKNIKTNEWATMQVSLKIPEATVSILIRYIARADKGTVFKFKNPRLITNQVPTLNLSTRNSQGDTSSNTTYYVSKQGLNTNTGLSISKPFLTIQKAVDSLPDSGGNIIVLDSGEYREHVNIAKSGHVKIVAKEGNRVNIFGSDKLVVTKTSGMTKVYQAPLAAKPVGLGGSRGKPVIFEWGTPSKPIPDNERHFLHRGLTHRLPYTEMFEVATKAELEATNGAWFWEAGVIYFTATDGSDATLKRYEARMRPALTHSKGSIELVRVVSWFSLQGGMAFSGSYTKRVACMAYGARSNGFSDNANFTQSYRDISGGNGNDGFNATVSDFVTNTEVNDRLEQTYFDPYGHDNGDDGLSDHYRSDCTIYGGLFEYNTKADVVHVTGSNSVCYNTEARGTANGFYASTAPTGDVARVKTVMRCVGTKSTNNGYSYHSADNTELHLDNCIANTPSIMGFRQSGTDGIIRANDCKFNGDPAKAKSGNVVINNSDLLTP